MSSGGRFLLSLGVILGVVTSAALLTGRGAGGQELPAKSFVRLPSAPQWSARPFPTVAPTPAAQAPNPSTTQQNAGIWATPALFGPPN